MWSSFNQYTGLTPNRFDAAWNNTYENILNEIATAKVNSAADGFAHFEAVFLTIEAISLMAATDVWDAIPYSDALKGIESTNPTYDSQESIYGVIMSNLSSALSKFNGASGAVVPGNEDVYYGGDIDLWKKAVSAIQARAMLHQGDLAGARTAAENSFESSADNLTFQYPDANVAGQWYRFNRDRTGDLEFHPTMRAIMQGLNDTARLAMMDQTFVTSHPYLVPNFLQEIISYREMQFIIAEVDVRSGGTEAGYQAYLNGIKASFERLGLSDADYEAYVAQENIAPGAGNLTLEDVMTQKYIGLFLDPEVYNDYRRTNIPDLVPVSGTNVPVRWDYSSTEYLFNSNSPAEGSVNIYTDRVGWNR